MARSSTHEITTNRYIPIDDLMTMMEHSWDTERCNHFTIGRPNGTVPDRCIILPATRSTCVIILTKEKGGFFSRGSKVVITCSSNEVGATHLLTDNVHDHNSGNIMIGIAENSAMYNYEREKNGIGAEAVKRYSVYVNTLLQTEGYI